MKDLATKADIKQLEATTKTDINRLELDIKQVELKIEKAKNQMLIWMGAFAVFMFGTMAKGFHWI